MPIFRVKSDIFNSIDHCIRTHCHFLRTLKIVAIFLSFRDIISLVKILAPDANHIIIPYSCARHKARTSKKQQQIKFSKPEHWFFTQSVIPGHHCFGQDFSFNMQIITLYHIPALIIKPKQVKYNKKSHFLILNIDFIFRASFRDNWFQEKAVK